MDDVFLTSVLNQAAMAVKEALSKLDDWSLAGTKPGQYRSDLVADAAALEVLKAENLAVLSEETGMSEGEGDLLVVLDPLDGSTNAFRGLPWFAVSMCVLDSKGPRVGLVYNIATGRRFEAVKGKGAYKDGVLIKPSHTTSLRSAFIGVSGYPPAYLGWKQYRALGSAALDLCCVAEGSLDGYIDCSFDAHGVWDYLGGMFVCQEAGASVEDLKRRELVVKDVDIRRTPIAGGTPELLAELRGSLNSCGSSYSSP